MAPDYGGRRHIDGHHSWASGLGGAGIIPPQAGRGGEAAGGRRGSNGRPRCRRLVGPGVSARLSGGRSLGGGHDRRGGTQVGSQPGGRAPLDAHASLGLRRLGQRGEDRGLLRHLGQARADRRQGRRLRIPVYQGAAPPVQRLYLLPQSAQGSRSDLRQGPERKEDYCLEMTFTSNTLGLNIDLSEITENDIIKVLFSENPGLILQVNDPVGVTNFLDKYKIKSIAIGKVTDKRLLKLRKGSNDWTFQLDKLRDIWFKTSWLFDSLQCSNNLASERFNNYKNQPLYYSFKEHFTGTYDSLALNPNRRSPSGIKAAIIREKGVNGDREMAYAMYLAGMDVKDVHMTDLIAGRETLEEIQMIVFVGGFSNSDVLGSAKGWAGAFLFNEKAKYTLDNFYKRNDTLSLGVCNGCQLMIELGLVTPEHKQKPVMSVNDSHKLESAFINVNIPENNSVMLSSLSGSRLGIWVANGEGKFNFPYNENKYHVAMKYSYEQYPGNPNGSDYSIAGICSEDGRHLAIMPHLERSVFPWNWAYYPQNMKFQQVTPWIEPFVNAMKWMKNRTKNQEPGTKT